MANRDPLPVPFAHKDSEFDCGPHALSLVAEFFGKKIPKGVWVIFCETSEQFGTRCDAMSWAARLAQFWTFESHDGTIEQLRAYLDLGYPIITYLFNPAWPDMGHGDFDRAHFEIVTSYNGFIVTRHDTDPPHQAGGADLPMPIDEFFALWNSDHTEKSKKWFLVLADHQLNENFKSPVVRKPSLY